MGDRTTARPTVARIWRGRTRRDRADEYEAYSFEVGIKPLIEKALGVQYFREDRATETEFVTVSYWESVEAMSRFAGSDPTRIHHLPRDPEFLIELPERVQILTIRASHGNTGGEPANSHDQFVATPIGWVESPLVDPSSAPKQGDEGAPDAWLIVDAKYGDGLRDIHTGDEVVVLTWLDRARRDLLRVHPRDDTANPMRGVFSTRSADRPNPIGLHRVQVLDIQETRIRVRNLEAVNGTPVLDLKPVLGRVGER